MTTLSLILVAVGGLILMVKGEVGLAGAVEEALYSGFGYLSICLGVYGLYLRGKTAAFNQKRAVRVASESLGTTHVLKLIAIDVAVAAFLGWLFSGLATSGPGTVVDLERTLTVFFVSVVASGIGTLDGLRADVRRYLLRALCRANSTFGEERYTYMGAETVEEVLAEMQDVHDKGLEWLMR